MKRILFLLTMILFFLSANAWAFEITIAGNVPVADTLTAIAENPETGMLAAVSKTGKSLFLIDVDSRKVSKKIALNTEPVVVAFDAERNRVLILSKDFLSFVDINGNNAVKSIQLSNSGSTLAVYDNWDMALFAVDGGLRKLDLLTDEVGSTLALPVKASEIRVFGDSAIVSGNAENGGFYLLRVNIHDGSIEKQLKMDSEVVGIDANKARGLVCAGSGSGDISLYDSNLVFQNKLVTCDTAAPCSMAVLSYHSLMNSVISVDALNDKITVTDLESKAVSAATVNYKGLDRIVTDSTRNMAMIVNEKGVLIAKLENPVPRIDFLIPQTAKSGSEGFTLSIEGDKFVRESQALFNGKNVETYFKSIEKLQVDISTEDLLYPGDVPVTVRNPLPGGGLSNSLLFKINDLAPVIESVSPEFVAVNTSFTLRVSGKNFFNGSIITLNGSNLKTRFISSILLEADVIKHLIENKGVYSVVVANPQPDGLTSNTGTLTVVDADDPRLQDEWTDQASQGTGSLKGNIVNTELKPLQGITIKVKNLRTVTDAEGNFFLQDIPAGKRVLLMDGSTAQETDGHYPTIPITVDIVAGKVNAMPFQPYLHRQKNKNFKHINPAEDTILTDPEVPGFEMRIPKGVNITGWDGQRNLKVSVRTVPPDRLPIKPLPSNVRARTVHMFYFDKVGGGTPDQPIPIKSRNELDLLPGAKALLLYYDESPNEGEAPNDWAIAGTGTVSDDGQYIVSDPGVGIPKFCCGATTWVDSSKDDTPPSNDPDGEDGEPVSIQTGYFIHRKTDLYVPGIIPVNITRYYSSGASGVGAFGTGMFLEYDWWLGGSQDMLRLIKPGNYKYDFPKQADGTYINIKDPAMRGAAAVKNTNNTVTLTMRDGWKYQFDNTGKLYAIDDRNGNRLTLNRRSNFEGGYLKEIITPEGRRVTFTQIYTGNFFRTDEITDDAGRSVKYHYVSYGGYPRLTKVDYPDGSSISYEYSGSGMTKITKNGKVVVMNEYDFQIINGNSSDKLNWVKKQTLSDGGTYIFDYVSAWSLSPDPYGAYETCVENLCPPVLPGGTYYCPCELPSKTPLGTETTMTAPNDAQTTWRFYDDSGAYRNGYITKKIMPDGVITYEREAGTDLLLSVTDPLVRRTSYTYYANGLVNTKTDALGNETTYEYEPKYGFPSLITDAKGKTTTVTYTYDESDRITNTVMQDSLSNQTTINFSPASGMPTDVTDPNLNKTGLLYENANRPAELTKIIDPLNNAFSIAYDNIGWISAVTDANNNTTLFVRDAAGRITSVTDANGEETKYYYDLAGKLSRLIDARGNSIAYEYDDRGRITKMTDQLGKSETYTYYRDAEITPATGDNLKSITDRKGQTTTFDEYDAMNRLKHVTYADGSTTSYTYDAAGRVTGITDSISGAISYTYNDFGCTSCSGKGLDKVARETTPLGTIDYTYDKNGRRLTMTVAGEPTVNYEYDDAGRLTSISRDIAGSIRTYPISYDAGSRRTSLGNPLDMVSSFMTTSYGYDAANNILKMITQVNTGTPIEQLEYSYDPNRNRESFYRYEAPPEIVGLESATYNEANELETFTPAASLAKTMTSDENGNLDSIADSCGTTTYTWDARNRLTAINGYDPSCATLSASFKYDALGRRIEKTINGSTIQYVYDGYDIIQEIQGGAKTNYIRTLKIDEPLTRIEPDGTVRHYVKDTLGSVIALTDDSGVVTTTYAYDPFGNTTVTGEASNNSFQYTGRENDGTGLYYYRARYYSPELQRFISEDPIGLRGGVNFYAYVGNNPINFIDPKGLEVLIFGRGPFYFRPFERIGRMPRYIPREAQRACRETPPRPPVTTGPGPTPNPAPTSPWAEFLQNLADLLDELSSGPPTTPYDPLDPYGNLET